MKVWYCVWRAQQSWLLWNFLSKFSFFMTISAELVALNLSCDLENFIRAEMKTVKPEQWAGLFTLGGRSWAGALASEEVQPSTVANSALWVSVFIHNHPQACLWNYSSARLYWTWKYQRTEEYWVKEICHYKLPAQLVASWFRFLFFWMKYWCLKASMSVITFSLNRRKTMSLKIHV